MAFWNVSAVLSVFKIVTRLRWWRFLTDLLHKFSQYEKRDSPQTPPPSRERRHNSRPDILQHRRLTSTGHKKDYHWKITKARSCNVALIDTIWTILVVLRRGLEVGAKRYYHTRQPPRLLTPPADRILFHAACSFA